MDKKQFEQLTERHIANALDAMFPYGEGRVGRARVEHHLRQNLRQIAQYAFQEGKTYALLGLLTAQDVAEHFQITPRRARALIKSRHERFGVGMQVGNTNVWLIHRDELPDLEPDAKYKSD